MFWCLLQWAELLEEGGTRRRIGEDHVFTGQRNIVKVTFRPVEERHDQGSSQPRAKPVSRVEKKSQATEEAVLPP